MSARELIVDLFAGGGGASEGIRLGAPTIRKRLFLIARRDGRGIVWPAPSHGDPKSQSVKNGALKPWRAAAEIIDWSLPCHSIFLTREEGRTLGVKRPLADATMARIAKGVKRYVIDAKEPFVVSLTHHGGDRNEGLSDPFRTITAAHRGEKALVAPIVARAQHGGGERAADAPLHTVTASRKDQNQVIVPTLVQTGYGERSGQAPRVPGLDKPLGTVVAGGVKHAVLASHLMTMRDAQKPHNEVDKPAHTITAGGAHLNLVSAFLAQHNTDMAGHAARAPLSTIVQKGCTQAVVSAGLLNQKGSDQRQCDVTGPAPTQTAGGWHIAETRAFLTKYYGTDQDPRLDEPLHTATTKDRFALCTVEIAGEPYLIVDIGMRMLTRRELFGAQGFSPDYIIDRGLFMEAGKPVSKPLTVTASIRMCGNSVSPVIPQALVGANLPELAALEAAA